MRTFNTAPGSVEGWFLLPRHVPRPMPAILLLHDWGGLMFFGKDRMYDLGDSCDLLTNSAPTPTAGATSRLSAAGYAVLSIDAYHLAPAPLRCHASRASTPPAVETHEGTAEFNVTKAAQENLYLSLRHCNGPELPGRNNFRRRLALIICSAAPRRWPPSRVNFRGGYRTNLLMALEDRLQAAASIGWMTTNDGVAEFNLAGAIGTFCLLPGVWDRMDVSDLVAMGFPKKSLVAVGQQDALFPPAGVDES